MEWLLSVYVPGSLHWESAKFGTQQAVGCSGGLSSCICPHADEAVSGKLTTFSPNEQTGDYNCQQTEHVFLC